LSFDPVQDFLKKSQTVNQVSIFRYYGLVHITVKRAPCKRKLPLV